MPIQIIIFITKTKIFASEIKGKNKADTISINGNSEIKCEGKDSVDEMLECLLDAFNAESFTDDCFDIVIIDCGSNKELLSYIAEKCIGDNKLGIIDIEKLLPLIVWIKTKLKPGEEVVAVLDEECYKIACDERHVVKFIEKCLKENNHIELDVGDFSYLYYFNVENMQGNTIDTDLLKKKEDIIGTLTVEKENLSKELSENQNLIMSLQKQIQDEKTKIAVLTKEKAQWEKENPKPPEIVEQMLKVIEKCKRETDHLGGDFYIKGAIPKKKLDASIEFFSKKFKKIEIKGENVIALYYPNECDTDGMYAEVLLLTKDFFCFDRDAVKRKPTIIYWGDLIKVSVDDDLYDDIIKFKLSDRKIIQMGVRNEDVIDEFLVPMFNKLKDIDEKQ